ncbi:MAG: metal-dependent hydrolase [Candidatus Riflebacteria bacterium]
MNIITHALAGWCIGRAVSERPRDAVVLFAASTIPDLDAVGALLDLYRGGEAIWFTALHHKFGHNIFFCLALLPLVWLFCRRPVMLAWWVVVFHFHLFCDVIGAMGPDGYQWPIYYLYPFSDYGLVWSGQWQINAWPNIAFTVFLLIVFIYQSARTSFSPIGLLSAGADRAFVETLRKRLGMTESP